jgi:hypothetical protein
MSLSSPYMLDSMMCDEGRGVLERALNPVRITLRE